MLTRCGWAFLFSPLPSGLEKTVSETVSSCQCSEATQLLFTQGPVVFWAAGDQMSSLSVQDSLGQGAGECGVPPPSSPAWLWPWARPFLSGATVRKQPIPSCRDRHCAGGLPRGGQLGQAASSPLKPRGPVSPPGSSQLRGDIRLLPWTAPTLLECRLVTSSPSGAASPLAPSPQKLVQSNPSDT